MKKFLLGVLILLAFIWICRFYDSFNQKTGIFSYYWAYQSEPEKILAIYHDEQGFYLLGEKQDYQFPPEAEKMIMSWLQFNTPIENNPQPFRLDFTLYQRDKEIKFEPSELRISYDNEKQSPCILNWNTKEKQPFNQAEIEKIFQAIRLYFFKNTEQKPPLDDALLVKDIIEKFYSEEKMFSSGTIRLRSDKLTGKVERLPQREQLIIANRLKTPIMTRLSVYQKFHGLKQNVHFFQAIQESAAEATEYIAYMITLPFWIRGVPKG